MVAIKSETKSDANNTKTDANVDANVTLEIDYDHPTERELTAMERIEAEYSGIDVQSEPPAQVLSHKWPISPTKKASPSLRNLTHECQEALKHFHPTPQTSLSHLEQLQSVAHLDRSHSATPQTSVPTPPDPRHSARLASPFLEVAQHGQGICRSMPVGPSYNYNYPHGLFASPPAASTVAAHSQMMFAPSTGPVQYFAIPPGLVSPGGAPSAQGHSFEPQSTSTPAQSKPPTPSTAPILTLPAAPALPVSHSGPSVSHSGPSISHPGPSISHPGPSISHPTPSALIPQTSAAEPPLLVPSPHPVLLTPFSVLPSYTAPSTAPLLVPSPRSVPPTSSSIAAAAPSDIKETNDDPDVNDGILPGGRLTGVQRDALEDAFSSMNKAI
ncbi:hypothetical protein E1B28_003364 [Marasmius oreades]|uniref:Uncharacterized protein n=1 Tax=Marasmius oreades TaxID=181124 RepID=A0A9P7RLB9_9AGAR|nr:uncharacterized protein E1B28_003364 [Marasmius oreades]KAG7085826.1 hypothetical protein E1B28_003364 [Marasmius oreades]